MQFKIDAYRTREISNSSINKTNRNDKSFLEEIEIVCIKTQLLHMMQFNNGCMNSDFSMCKCNITIVKDKGNY